MGLPERQQTPSVYDWRTSVGFAIVGTVAAVVLIVVFTYLDDVIGSFWSQVVYFLAVFGGVVAAAERSRRKDIEDPGRLGRSTTPITPVGLPGPFAVTQALGVLGVTMLIAGAIIGDGRGIIWVASGWVLVLVGGVGLVFWTAGIAARRRAQ